MGGRQSPVMADWVVQLFRANLAKMIALGGQTIVVKRPDGSSQYEARAFISRNRYGARIGDTINAYDQGRKLVIQMNEGGVPQKYDKVELVDGVYAIDSIWPPVISGQIIWYRFEIEGGH